MFNGNTKRVVILRGIPSNVVEEAILILKNEPESKPEKGSTGVASDKTQTKHNDYLIKEAEEVIKNYIKDLKLEKVPKSVSVLSMDKHKSKFYTNVIINTALIASIALLILIVARII